MSATSITAAITCVSDEAGGAMRAAAAASGGAVWALVQMTFDLAPVQRAIRNMIKEAAEEAGVGRMIAR